MTTRAIAAATILALLGLPLSASAGGLYVSEFATPSMGTAGAGALARGADASSALHNPATMTRLDSHQINMGLAPGASIVKFDPDSDTPVSGSSGGNQGGLIPLLGSSYVHKVSDRWRFGLGIFSVSGASLDPNSNWAGRNQLTKIDLLTLTFLPTLAVRVTDWLSVGAGPQISYGRLDWKLSAPLPSPPAPLGSEGTVKLDGLDDWAVAPMVGIMVEPSEDLRFGIVYQGETKFKLTGDTKIPAGVSANTRLRLPLAQAVRMDVYWQAMDKVALLAGWAWENWDQANTVPLTLGPVSTSVKLGMKDTWKLRGGVHYQLNEKWLLQTGLSYDSSALNTNDRIAALPIDEQWRFGIGAIHDWSEHTRLSFAFEYVNLGDGKINNGTLKGDYKRNDIFFFMINVNFAKLPWDGMLSF
jgi:long-chain fatty acid transport protein